MGASAMDVTPACRMSRRRSRSGVPDARACDCRPASEKADTGTFPDAATTSRSDGSRDASAAASALTRTSRAAGGMSSAPPSGSATSATRT